MADPQGPLDAAFIESLGGRRDPVVGNHGYRVVLGDASRGQVELIFQPLRDDGPRERPVPPWFVFVYHRLPPPGDVRVFSLPPGAPARVGTIDEFVRHLFLAGVEAGRDAMRGDLLNLLGVRAEARED